METKKIEQQIRIDATAERVWQVLWDSAHYKTWAAAFMEGSTYSGELQQDGLIRFHDGNGNGMESRVASITENREITFEHLHEIADGKAGQSFGNMREQYLLDEKEGVTTLAVSSEMPEQYFDEMDAAMKEALKIIKKLAEG